MKIGLRLGQCLADIIEGKVIITDVLVLVVNSKFDPRKDDHWKMIWNHYTVTNKTWATGHHEEVYKYTLRRLHDSGKLHQPRVYGGRAHRFEEAWIDTVPTLRNIVPHGITYPELATMPDILI